MSGSAPSLQETFRTVHGVLRGGPARAASSRLGLDPERVAFYRDTVYAHFVCLLLNVLADIRKKAVFLPGLR